jgi:hypothetical protein
MTTKHYQAPWGRRVRLITLAVLGFAVAFSALLPLLIRNAEDRPAEWIVPLALVAVFGGTALFFVRGFEITDSAVLVHRSFWRNRIPLAQIETAEVDPRACERAWKTCGNDGLFAMHGRFRNKRLGKFQAYVTDPDNAVVLRVPGDIIVISPEHPRQFVQDLNRRLARLKEQR